MNLASKTNKKERILIKVSGGCLTDTEKDIFNAHSLISLANQIKVLTKKYEIGIVVGGGNIWRGKSNYLNILSNQSSHYVGMLATVMNGMVLQSTFASIGLKADLFSGLNCGALTKEVSPNKIEDAFINSEVIIFAGGTGLPFLSTDTAAAIRAVEIGAKKILMGKDNVAGVYNDDPKKNPNAIFYPELTYLDLLEKKLAVMDPSALTVCEENGIEILVFNQAIKDAFVLASENKITMTKIRNK